MVKIVYFILILCDFYHNKNIKKSKEYLVYIASAPNAFDVVIVTSIIFATPMGEARYQHLLLVSRAADFSSAIAQTLCALLF